MHRLIDLLAQAMEVHGFVCTRQAALEGRSGTVYTVPLLAENEEGAILIDVQRDDPLPAEAVADMEDVLHDVGGDRAVVCHTGDAEAVAASGVVLWDRQQIVQVVGEALVCRSLGVAPAALSLHGPPPSPLAESLTELLPAAFLDDEPAPSFDLDALEDLGTPSFDLDALEFLGAATDSTTGARQEVVTTAPGPDAPPQSAPTPDAPVEPAPHHGHPLLPVRVTPDDARIRIKNRIERVERVQMLLQPVHLLDYECDLLAEGSLRYDTINGRVQVHGTDKTVTEVDPEAVDPQGFTRLPELPSIPSQARTLRVSEERARERSGAYLLEAHTRLVDIEVDDPDLGYSYTEKKKVAPRPDHVRLHCLGVFHRVVWRMIGSAGHMDVDALTGEILEEVVQQPRHDSMVID